MKMKDVLKFTLENAVKYGGKANVGAVMGKLLSENPKLRSKAKQVAKDVAKAVAEVNRMKLEEQVEKLRKIAPELLEKKAKARNHGLPELPTVKGKKVLRLAPYPSGPLHIGNTKTFILNDEYAKRYNGKLILVMDDTIGSAEKEISPDAYKLIPDGLEWLGVKFDSKIIYKSDRLETYYKYAGELIKKEKAYVCFCEPEVLRKNRAEAKVCECRENAVDKNLIEWENMFAKLKEGAAVLRLKTSMDHPNPAFRDRVLFRISDRKHPRTGKKYRVWPLLEFSWAIDDHLLGVTHIIRGKDLMMESEMEIYLWDIFGWKIPEIIHTALVKLEGVMLSKSKSSQEVKSGVYSGWDDPRTWSLKSLERRGIMPDAIRAFVLGFGLNQNEISVPVDTLYSENRKILDPIARRYFFVEGPKRIDIEGAPEKKVKLKLHPDKKIGFRKFDTSGSFYIAGAEKLSKGKTYRLMNLLNFKDSNFISFEHDPKLKAKMLHWLPDNAENIEVEVLMPDGSVRKGLAEEGVKKLEVGSIIQFERFGFCRLNKKGKKLVFWFAHN